eukprot:gene6680-7765_t
MSKTSHVIATSSLFSSTPALLTPPPSPKPTTDPSFNGLPEITDKVPEKDGANEDSVPAAPSTPDKGSITPRSGSGGKRSTNKGLKRVRRILGATIESPYWITAMIVSILYIIFINDIIGVAGSPSSKAQNNIVVALKIIVMAFFTLDIVASVVLYWRRYYPGTIVFWLDLVSVLAIIPDIVVFFLDQSLSSNLLVLTIARSARIIRICGSFVRLSLISTLYARFVRRPTRSTTNDDSTLEVEASKLGDKLIRLTTNKIVLLVLMVFFATQLLTYQPPRDVYVRSSLASLEYQATKYGVQSITFQEAYQQQTRERVESIGSKSDATSSSGVDGDDERDEAGYLLGMLSDIDGQIQAAKEKVEEESTQNLKLKRELEDVWAEKFSHQIHIRSLLRKIEFEDPIGMWIKKKQILLTSGSDGKQLADGISSDEIKFREDHTTTEKYIVLGGTLDKLLERLTMVENHDMKFANVFLMTFRRFITPVELMERLIIRFCITPQTDVSPNLLQNDEFVETWRKTKQDQIRISIFNVFKLWIGKYYWDFPNNIELVELFNCLLHQIMPLFKMDRYAIHLDTLLKRKMMGYIPLQEYVAPMPLSGEEVAELMVVDDRLLYNFDVQDLAVQITLVEFELFKSIRPHELLDLAWTKKTKTKTSPNVVRFIDHFNTVSFWMQMQIVKNGKIKDRVAAIKRVIALADAFVSLNNFYGAMEVLSSLESAAVSRLAKTWEQVPVASMNSFQALQKLLSPKGSFKEYRDRLKQTTSACIPYLGIYLSDLNFIYEANHDYRDELINVTKLREIAATILAIQQFQNTIQYYYEVKEKIRSQLDLKVVDSETIWGMSQTCEASSRK